MTSWLYEQNDKVATVTFPSFKFKRWEIILSNSLRDGLTSLFVFLLRARRPLKLEISLEISQSQNKKTKWRELNDKYGSSRSSCPPHVQNLNVRFETEFTTATTKFEKSTSKTKNEWPSTATRLSFALDVSSCISWNRLSNRLSSETV